MISTYRSSQDLFKIIRLSLEMTAYVLMPSNLYLMVFLFKKEFTQSLILRFKIYTVNVGGKNWKLSGKVEQFLKEQNKGNKMIFLPDTFEQEFQ